MTVRGDANKSDILRLASAQHAKAIVVATNSDPTAVLVTLTARELAPNAKIIASVREAENRHLPLQSGADSVWCPPIPPAGCSGWPPASLQWWR